MRRVPRPSRRLDERGLALSSPLALVSAAAVVLAGVAFVSTGKPHEAVEVAAPVTATTSPTATPTHKAPTPVIKEKKKPAKPEVKRAGTLVEVYNNSGIHGLADRTSRRASGAGWQVVGSDNWYGTIAASTVYYPRRLEAEAKLLARDLGIRRLKPAIAPMRFDRLTVILTVRLRLTGSPGPSAGWLARRMERATPEADQRYDDLVKVAHDVVVGLDFDGTLSPIVDDPERAVIHPDGPGALVDLASQVRAVAVITGRPARQVVELGRLETVADALPAGAMLEVLGQYGNERWDSRSRTFATTDVPPGLAALREELPGLLADADAADAYVEEKGLAVAVHTRPLAGRGGRLRPPEGRPRRRRRAPRPRASSPAGWCSRSAPLACTRVSRSARSSPRSTAAGCSSSATTSGTSRPSRPPTTCATRASPPCWSAPAPTRRRRSSSSPTSSSPVPTASSSCSAASPPTSLPAEWAVPLG